MLTKETFIAFAFIKKEKFTGSMQGMRYRLEKEVEKNEESEETYLLVSIWPEPNSYEKTQKELIQTKRFAFSEEGREQAIDWLNAQFLEQKALWDLSNPYL